MEWLGETFHLFPDDGQLKEVEEWPLRRSIGEIGGKDQQGFSRDSPITG